MNVTCPTCKVETHLWLRDSVPKACPACQRPFTLEQRVDMLQDKLEEILGNSMSLQMEIAMRESGR